MSTVGNFEELEVWKVGMGLSTEIYRLTNLEAFSKDFGLKDQLRKASVSVPSNISEGYKRMEKPIFVFSCNCKRFLWRSQNSIENCI